MQSQNTSAGFQPDAAFANAAERFFELLKTFGMSGTSGAPDWAAMAAPLAGQFEQWLRLSQSAGPWFSGVPGGMGWPGMPAASSSPGGTASPPWPFAPLPLGAAAAHGKDAQRALELLGKLAQLQGELAVHWSEIARSAAQRFVARLRTGAAPPTSLDQALKMYELWVSCAEEAYAATVHKADFGRLQAEIANTTAALLVEQRRHVDSMARAFGLPTRTEVDELYAQLKELRRRVDAPAHTPRAAAGSGGEAASGTRRRRAKAASGGAKRPRGASRTRPKRTRRPRP